MGRIRYTSVTTVVTRTLERRQYSSGEKSGPRGFFRRFTTTRRDYSFSQQPNRDPGLAITSVLSDPNEVEGPKGLPSRAEQVRRLEHKPSVLKDDDDRCYDVLVIGAGATGAGIALDAATRGISVACIERGDFSSETSSRSTKLIWAGIRYMATATAILLSPKLLSEPITTVQDFYGEMKMVINCHRERRYMMDKQEHLCNWIPIAIPFTEWHVSPPPFGHWLYGFFPILAPAVLKFYDSLSFFSCPPSYIMTPSQARKSFPQLEDKGIKYCAVFYEAQHNDARTNIAIAMSAAEHGAAIANYVEMIDTVKDLESGKVVGVEALDRMTGRTFQIKARKVIFAGGPFTDSLRQMEQKEDIQPAVRGASGTHIVLPGYYCPNNVS
jgi:glycerol-3-phosphate dehydrogenase